ncbi:sensor histidine kinase [Paenibacillus lignilyticus]|uniref:Histidine kinase n=1 Tax=Paenibacillus lignilyticus TaxID=1172615 RepID=A0ABS5CFI4_9BACL|nr:histidine kinase [Paenibacillus lignilyticus]MBP3964603.1 histidine kinase [Paenibacillus lignilyticus]
MGNLTRMRIKTQLQLAVALIVIIMLMIIYSLYTQTSQIVIQNNNQYTEDTIRKFKLNLTQKTDEISQIMLSLGFDPFVQKFMTQNDPSLLYEMSNELDRKIISLKAGRKGFQDIVLIGTSGMRYSLNGSIDFVQRSNKEIESNKTVYVSGLEPYDYSSTSKNSMLFAQNIYSSDLGNGTDGNRIGYIAVIIDVEAMFFDDDRSKAEPGIGFYLIDRFGSVYPETNSPDITRTISALSSRHNSEQKLTDSIGGVKGAIQIQRLDQINASVLSFVPQEALLAELGSVRNRSILIVILSILLMAVPFAVITNNIVQPIQRLVRFINGIKSGSIQDLKTTIHLEGNVEMNVVAENLNGMLSEIDNLTHRLVETNTHLLEAEIEKEKAATAYLRSQINPHFLYNTLESIKGVALEAENRQIVEMTKALGKLFHYSIKGSGYVTLDQELNAVKSYVYLQLIRFEDRFDVTYHFSDEALQVSVLRMMLQPLVENAIFHGLEPKTSKGNLTIAGQIEHGHTLVLRITDDGMGVDEDTLRRIQGKLLEKPSSLSRDSQDSPDSDSIGLLNVNNRLRLAYGFQYGLTFESEAGHGTCITLTMPSHYVQPGGDIRV